jgi:hypothetical protein
MVTGFCWLKMPAEIKKKDKKNRNGFILQRECMVELFSHTVVLIDLNYFAILIALKYTCLLPFLLKM